MGTKLQSIVADSFDVAVEAVGGILLYRRSDEGGEAQDVPCIAEPMDSVGRTEGAAVVAALDLWDFFVKADKLKIDDTQFLPARGDIIVHEGVNYIVTPMPGLTHFEFADPDRQILRIHAKDEGAAA